MKQFETGVTYYPTRYADGFTVVKRTKYTITLESRGREFRARLPKKNPWSSERVKVDGYTLDAHQDANWLKADQQKARELEIMRAEAYTRRCDEITAQAEALASAKGIDIDEAAGVIYDAIQAAAI